LSFHPYLLISWLLFFKLPLLLLVKAEIIKTQVLKRQWRIFYIVILLLSAIITRDWSIVTMAVLAVSMILLYELSLLSLKVFK